MLVLEHRFQPADFCFKLRDLLVQVADDARQIGELIANGSEIVCKGIHALVERIKPAIKPFDWTEDLLFPTSLEAFELFFIHSWELLASRGLKT